MLLAAFESISKYFPDTGTRALNSVSLDINTGEVHALVGENGAGKSTLARILCGFLRPDSGRIVLRGREVRFYSHKDAERAGIGYVPQYSMLAQGLTASDNLALGHEPRKLGVFYDRRRAENDFLILAERFGFSVDPLKPVSQLSQSERRELEIMRALARAGDILVLDEPTSILGEKESSSLFTLIRRLKKSGVAIVYISHRSGEILDIADRVTVLMDGILKTSLDTKELTEQSLAKLIVSSDLSFAKAECKTKVNAGKTVLELEEISLDSSIDKLSLAVNSGEIVGITALDCNGLEELEAMLSGEKSPDSGKIHILGMEPGTRAGKKKSLNAVAYLPTDREAAGLCMKASAGLNAVAAKLYDFGFAEYARGRSPLTEAERMLAGFGVKAWQRRQIDSLSGGNRQRVMAARELDGYKALVIAANPAQGLDASARALVFKRLSAMRDEGSAVLLLSSDPEDAASLADRSFALYRGRLQPLEAGSAAWASSLTGAE